MSISVKAPAKVNLYLHVVGKRSDGYHLLDSLFAFTTDGDVITVCPSDDLKLDISGSDLSCGEDNIIIKAARLLAQALEIEPKAHIHLQKNLPIASGIGGGSSDAAATLIALQQLWNKQLPTAKLHRLALALGADVPSCLAGQAVQVAGIGEKITPAVKLPATAIVLVNPNKPVSTPAVFKSRKPVFSQPMPLTNDLSTVSDFVAELKKRHNDLQESACLIEPSVTLVLNALKNIDNCLFSAMSGSGGTCFGLFDSETKASKATLKLQSLYPDWWIRQSVLL